MTRYELLDRIGVGGMAEIFRGKAVAAGGFEKPVAIKRILPHLSQDRRFVELLIAEAKVLSMLKHRNIVQIFDVGLGDDGQYFLVMEFVDGRDLGAVQRGLEARRKRMPFDLVLNIGAEICDALEHAHSARGPDGKPMSLVHRDVSPTNVLVSRAGEIKLTDFGIAKRAEEATGHGAVRGKFAYISPEQARNEHLNARSDLFAVGLLLWELVTGRRLFSALPDLEALRSVREAKVPTPTSVDPRLPPGVDDLLMTALAADPAKRYATAGQFGAKLRALRYALEVTTGDPATELGKLVEIADQVARERERAPVRVGVSRVATFAVASSESTVIRIQTADAFSTSDESTGLVKARAVIDRFDEEETRLAQLSGGQMQQLRGGRARESSSVVAPPPPARRPAGPAGSAGSAGDDEPTTARVPLEDAIDLPDTSDTLPPENVMRDTPVEPQPAMSEVAAELAARRPRGFLPNTALVPGGVPRLGTLQGMSPVSLSGITGSSPQAQASGSALKPPLAAPLQRAQPPAPLPSASASATSSPSVPPTRAPMSAQPAMPAAPLPPAPQSHVPPGKPQLPASAPTQAQPAKPVLPPPSQVQPAKPLPSQAPSPLTQPWPPSQPLLQPAQQQATQQPPAQQPQPQPQRAQQPPLPQPSLSQQQPSQPQPPLLPSQPPQQQPPPSAWQNNTPPPQPWQQPTAPTPWRDPTPAPHPGWPQSSAPHTGAPTKWPPAPRGNGMQTWMLVVGAVVVAAVAFLITRIVLAH